jgi:hypothetical protein
MKGRLASEQQQQQQLTRQLKQLQHARAARACSTQWHLSSVQLYHNKVVQAAPVTVSALPFYSLFICTRFVTKSAGVACVSNGSCS